MTIRDIKSLSNIIEEYANLGINDATKNSRKISRR